MADMEFDLGEALGGYEQAKADRNFYLDMMHQGQQNMGAFMASPIAAYLAGVSGVKMANMRAKAQDIEDRRQAEKDAIAANEKLQKRRDNLDNQIVALVKGARDGSIPPSVAATMIGRLGKERGMDIKQFDADRGVLIGREPGDTEDFEWDLSERENPIDKRTKERIDWEREKQNRGIEGQKEVAAYKKSLSNSGSVSKDIDPWSTFKDANKDTLEYLQLPIEDEELADVLPRRAAIEFISGAEELPEARKKTLSSQIKRLKSIYNITPEEIEGITVKEQPVNLDSLW